jgi:hypothetical protein
VLESFGDFELVRRGGRLIPGDSSWTKLVGKVDHNVRTGADDPLRDPARYLMLALMEGRHRLSAHRRADHAAMTGWDREGVPETVLLRVQMPWDGAGAAEAAREGGLVDLLALYDRLMDRLDVPQRRRASDHDRTQVSTILEVVVRHAGSLDLPDRLVVSTVMSEAGWVTRHPTETIDSVLRLTAGIVGGTGPY